MKILKIFTAVVLFSVLALPVFAADDPVFGYWKIIDDETGKARSIIGIYKYEGKLYGRLILNIDDAGAPNDSIYSPVEKAEMLPDQPYYAGLDIIWELEWRDGKWKGGTILDPEKPKAYNSEIWYDGDKEQLVVRGKVGPFGRSQFWVPVAKNDLPADFILPDMSQWKPKIPRVE